MYHKTKLS